MNKRLVLTIVILLIIGILSGCSKGMPEGFESKDFFKDMTKIYDLVNRSITDREYYKDEISLIVDKINNREYINKLNAYEVVVLESTKKILQQAESDLTTGKKMIQSYTYNDIQVMIDLLDK